MTLLHYARTSPYQNAVFQVVIGCYIQAKGNHPLRRPDSGWLRLRLLVRLHPFHDRPEEDGHDEGGHS